MCIRQSWPCEWSLFPGVEPGKIKISLVALGQLASPLQSAWIGGHLVQHWNTLDIIREQQITPKQAVSRQTNELLKNWDRTNQVR